MIVLDSAVQYAAFKDPLEFALDTVVYRELDKSNVVKSSGWIDTIIAELYDWWTPNQTREPTPLPPAIIHYLNNRISDDAVSQFISRTGPKTWSAFPITLSPVSQGVDPRVPTGEALAVLWRILSLERRKWKSWSDPPLDAILEAVVNTGSELTSSVTAMLKVKNLNRLLSGPFDLPLQHQLLCTETALALPREFLQGDASAAVPCAQIHASHHIRLANGMHRAANSDEFHVELLGAVISCKIFDLYAATSDPTLGPSERHAWLDDAIA
ncbi:hypothetical protein B0H17DRAFT_1142222 [Mycena rosella]|uniref:Uncharacterized protein n=1 Tax=Mycena rosella TaxID=1033263 RepID=A0AAD7G9L2_MYCRO|nr:hypothetical protein B0H17DRAFT_1142222 [Mycena rosella]